MTKEEGTVNSHVTILSCAANVTVDCPRKCPCQLHRFQLWFTGRSGCITQRETCQWGRRCSLVPGGNAMWTATIQILNEQSARTQVVMILKSKLLEPGAMNAFYFETKWEEVPGSLGTDMYHLRRHFSYNFRRWYVWSFVSTSMSN